VKEVHRTYGRYSISIFLINIVADVNYKKTTVADHFRFNQPVLIVSSCYWNENNCPHTSTTNRCKQNRAKHNLHFNSAIFVKICTWL